MAFNTLRFLLLLLLPFCFVFQAQSQEKAPGPVYRLVIDDAIGPATSEYFSDGLVAAANNGASLVVLEMDTPGGLDTAMRDIIKNILASPVPVATFVHPAGARAASAGTYILYASHIAAMTPGTNLGAATPVQMGGQNPLLPEDLAEKWKKGSGEKTKKDRSAEEPQDQEGVNQQNQTGGAEKKEAAAEGAAQPAKEEKAGDSGDADAMRHKVINDASAYIRGLAELRGRNIEWAEKAVRVAASQAAKEALENNVIDILASDIADLLTQIDGRIVEVDGEQVTLRVSGASLVDFDPDWRHQFLAVITNPSVTYVLIMIGMYGLFFEFSNPGAVIPGVAGAICLLLAAYGLQLLPVNYAGLGLILLGVALMIGETFAPSFGALGIGGVVAFVVGSIILIDTDAPGFGIPYSLIGSFALVSLLTLTLVLGMLLRSRRKPVVSGGDAILGSHAEVVEDFIGDGSVRVGGELWHAQCEQQLHKNQAVSIVSRNGLILVVKPLN